MGVGAWTTDDLGRPRYSRPGQRGSEVGKWCHCLTCGKRFPTFKRNPGVSCCKAHNPKAKRSPCPDGLFELMLPDEAWLAGLIWADGYLRRSHPRFPAHDVTVAVADRDIAERAARIGGGPLWSYPPTGKGRSVMHAVRVTGLGVDRLRSLGLTPRKSLTTPWPDLPYHAYAHFLRGYFDGDGSVYVARTHNGAPRLVSGYVSSEQFIRDSWEFLRAEGIVNGGSAAKHGHSAVHYLRFNHADSMSFAEFIYDGWTATTCLTRKRSIFDSAR